MAHYKPKTTPQQQNKAKANRAVAPLPCEEIHLA